MKIQFILFLVGILVLIVTQFTDVFSVGTMGASITFMPDGQMNVDIDAFSTCQGLCASGLYVTLPYVLVPLGLVFWGISKALSQRTKPRVLYFKGAGLK